MKSHRHSRMEGSGTVMSLQEFIASVDDATLPRILQVCSGVYFQGSVYELSGCEVCLSTGDLVKVIDLKLLSASCTDIASKSTYELPIDHKGLFKVVAEDMPYSSVEEMVGLLPVGVDVVGSFSFVTRSQLTVGNFSMAPGQVLTLLSSAQGYARCQVTGPEGSKVEVRIPLSQGGLFYECQSEHGYSLRQILTSERLRSRRFRSLTSKSCGGPLLFSPIYQIEAIMHMRKNIVNFPSSLEVDVVDVTETSQHIEFVKPLTLPEVCTQHPHLHPPQGGDATTAANAIFPVVAEILEAPEASRHFFQCEWHPRLQKGARLVLHGHGERSMVLASTPQGRKARQYFLLQSGYAGRLRRKAREFGSVYELYVAASRVGCGGGSVGGGKGVKKGGGGDEGLRVSATRNCEAVEEEGLPELEVGDQLEVLRCEQVELPGAGEGGKAKHRVEALLCRRIQEDDDDDDDDEDDEDKGGKGHSKEDLVYLPLFMGAQFMEVISDKKKYSLAELGKGFALPLDVKVASRDTDLEKDPLPGLPVLKLEEVVVEPCVRASLLEKPHLCFELPTRWLHMSVSFTSEPLPWPREQPPKLCLETVTEVKEQFYYEFRKLTTNQEAAPPPRPPKRATSQEPTAKPKPLAKSTRNRERGMDRNMEKDKDTPLEVGKKTRSMSTSLCQLSLDSGKQKRNPPPPPTPTESAVDEPPPIIPRKPEAHRVSSTVPNTYVRAPKKKKDKTRGRGDSDSDHDYETVEDMVRNAQESVMFY